MSARFEIAIVGGGPAGLSAAIWLARYLRSTVLIDSGDPRNWETRGINGLLGHDGINPPGLRAAGRAEATKYGAKLIDDEVKRVARSDGSLTLELAEGGVLTTSRLLLAYGIRDVWPDVPGLERVYGDTAHVCPDCDGYEARGKNVVVIGSGKKAVGMALALATWTDHIIICTNGSPADMPKEECAKLDALNIPVLQDRMVQMRSSEGEVHSIELEGGKHLDCERVFFSIGQVAADDLGNQLGCARDDLDRIEVDDRGETSVKGVYAAGDLVPGPQLAVSAAASGAVAALAIHKSLLPDSQRLD